MNAINTDCVAVGVDGTVEPLVAVRAVARQAIALKAPLRIVHAFLAARAQPSCPLLVVRGKGDPAGPVVVGLVVGSADTAALFGFGGTLAVAGIHLSRIPPLDYARHLFRERTLRSVTANTRADGEEFLRVAGEHRLHVVTSPYPFDRADEALVDLANDAVDGAAVLLCDAGSGPSDPTSRS